MARKWFRKISGGIFIHHEYHLGEVQHLIAASLGVTGLDKPALLGLDWTQEKGVQHRLVTNTTLDPALLGLHVFAGPLFFSRCFRH